MNLEADIKSALIGGNTAAVSVLRMLKAELQNARIAAGADLSEADELKVIRKAVKQRAESAAAYRSAGSEERAAAEESEGELLKGYLPAGVDDQELTAFLKQRIAEGETNAGKLTGAAIRAFAGRTDGAQATRLIAGLLS